MKKVQLNNIYNNEKLNKSVKIEESNSLNALSSLFSDVKKISNDFLFAIGIKNAPAKDINFDLTNLSAFLSSAKSLGYEVEVMSTNL